MNGGVCTAPDTCDCSAAVGYAGVDCNSRKYISDSFWNINYIIANL